MSKIIAQLNGVNLFEKEDWDIMSDFLINNLPFFKIAFSPLILMILMILKVLNRD
jgi:hypothetical protein